MNPRRFGRKPIAAAVTAVLLGALLGGCSGGAVKKGAGVELAAAQSAYARRDYAEAARRLEPLAMQGNPEAQYALGYLYYYGRGVPRDRGRAIGWFSDAKRLGHPHAGQVLARIEQQARITQLPQETTAPTPVAQAPAPKVVPAPISAPTVAACEPAPAAVTATPQTAPAPQPTAHQAAAPARAMPEASAEAKAVWPPSYVLQLLSSRRLEDLERLVEAHGLKEAYYFQAQYRGEIWYGLLHGGFETVGTARDALRRLSPELKRHSPFVRNFPQVAVAAMGQDAQEARTGSAPRILWVARLAPNR